MLIVVLSLALASLPMEELHARFDALNRAVYPTSSVETTQELLAVAQELDRRGQLTAREARSTQGALEAARLFAPARDFAQRHGLPAPPMIHMPPRLEPPVLLESRNSDDAFDGRTFHLPAGGYVLAVGSPLCHFTVDAVAAIGSTQDLARILRGHLQWIVPQLRGGWSDIRAWNRAHSADTMALVYRETQWPQIDAWETPVFYFFRDRQLVGKVTGWPKQGRVAEMNAAARAAGLLPPTPGQPE